MHTLIFHLECPSVHLTHRDISSLSLTLPISVSPLSFLRWLKTFPLAPVSPVFFLLTEWITPNYYLFISLFLWTE